MADTKISALTGATTPLAGTEEFPLVQSSTTKKATISNIQVAPVSSGIANGVQYLDGSKVPTTSSSFIFNGTSLGIGVTPTQKLTIGGSADAQVTIRSSTTTGSSEIYLGDSDAIFRGAISYAHTTDSISIYTAATKAVDIDSSQNFSLAAGNLAIGTAAKGVNFTANTGAAGMTSQLLNWYEEGTWTATLSDGTNNATMGVSTCAYTRIGRQVTVSGLVSTTSLGSVTGAIRITGLPFTVANGNSYFAGSGLAYGDNFAITAGQSVSLLVQNNSTYMTLRVWSATTGNVGMTAAQWTATGAAAFSVTYFV